MTKVLQCDREAAFEVLCRTDDTGGMGREYIRDGMDDGNFVVQAFAHHREEAQAELLDAANNVLDFAEFTESPSARQAVVGLEDIVARIKGEA